MKQKDESLIDELGDYFSRHQRRFILAPKQWSQFNISTSLVWKQVALQEKNIESIPKTRGIYAHSICISLPNVPPNGYLTYVGIVGDRNLNSASENPRHLRQRFKEYLGEQKKLNRVKVWEVLRKYADHMVFHYAEVTDTTVELTRIETALLDALLPPCNQKDFSIDIGTALQLVTTK